MEVVGKVKLVKETETVGTNGFQKRDLIVTTDEQYPQDIAIQFVQDKCSVLDSYKIGQDVKVSINLRGREWINPQGEAVYFNTIQGWRIESVTNQPATTPKPMTEEQRTVVEQEDGADDLPF